MELYIGCKVLQLIVTFYEKYARSIQREDMLKVRTTDNSEIKMIYEKVFAISKTTPFHSILQFKIFFEFLLWNEILMHP